MNDEKIEDIVAVMRGMGNYQSYSGDHAQGLARRIEAAMRRERESYERSYTELRAHIKRLEADCTKAMRALKPVMACDISHLGPFPLLVEPNAKVDIYRSAFNGVDELCGSGRNAPSVFNHGNLIVSECQHATEIANALNAVREAHRIMDGGAE